MKAPVAVRQGVVLRDYTTWRIGGPAEWFAEPTSAAEWMELAAWAEAEGLPFFKKGNPTAPGNYRCIQLVSMLRKIIATTLSMQLKGLAEQRLPASARLQRPAFQHTAPVSAAHRPAAGAVHLLCGPQEGL